MDEFISSLPEVGKKAMQDVDKYFEAFKPFSQEWNGVQLIPFFSKEAAKFAYEEWTPRAGDVFVVTYPKAGTHWMDEVVRQVLFLADENCDLTNCRYEKQLKGQTFLEQGPASKFVISDHLPCRRIFDTHLPEELINYEKIKGSGAKAIYVYRNPKDLILSYYHFNQKLPYPPELSHLKINDWTEFLDSLTSGKMPTGVPTGEWYPYHMKSWIKHRGDGTTMFVSFEDMKRDLPKEVRKIAEFLGVTRREDEILEISRRCTFETMKEVKANQHLSKLMYRKGQVGGWKDQFTVAQNEMIDKRLEKDFTGVDIEFTYEL